MSLVDNTAARLTPLLAASLLLSGCGAEEAPQRPPNVVIWLVDTLRPDHLGCYGYARPTSPNIDALAASGVLFTDAHAHSNWTQPSVASILSGRDPLSFSAEFTSPVPEGLELAAEVLARHGYATAGFTVTAATAARYGFAQGFATYEELDLLLDPKQRKTRSAELYGADSLVDVAVDWIDRGSFGAAPFFLFLHSVDPHAPYGDRATPNSFAAPYDGPVDGSVEFLVEAQRTDYVYSAADRQYILDRYDDDVRFNDEQFGRLVASLSERGLLEQTLLVVVSDHGEEFWEHGGPQPGHGHRNLHRELTQIPLILSWKDRLPAGVRVDGLMRGVDILPTLLDLAGLPALAESDGHSVAGVLRGGGGATRRLRGDAEDFPLFADRAKPKDPPLVALRTGAWLLQRDGEGDGAVERLNDLAADPTEQRDVAQREAQRTNLYRERLSAWMAQRAQHAHALGGRTEIPLDARTQEQLEALGYVGGKPRR
ncbi:MAG: sulfatase [Planctomycetota bacterium]